MDKKTESLEAVEKMLKKLRKKQKETGKAKMPKNKEVIEPLKNLPSSKEKIDEFTEGVTMKKAMGGKIQTEYRGGGMVNLGNFKGQF
jgi:hypothetical protein